MLHITRIVLTQVGQGSALEILIDQQLIDNNRGEIELLLKDLHVYKVRITAGASELKQHLDHDLVESVVTDIKKYKPGES